MESLENVAKEVLAKWGRIDILLNIAGGNLPGATLMPDQEFFDMKISDWDKVTNLELERNCFSKYGFWTSNVETKKRKHHQYVIYGGLFSNNSCSGLFGCQNWN